MHTIFSKLDSSRTREFMYCFSDILTTYTYILTSSKCAGLMLMEA